MENNTPTINTNIPIYKFEQIANVLDDRFIKVKIYVAHVGENRNACMFSKEVLESMIPSLANVPILGYIAVDENGEKDFKAHEERLVVEDSKLKLKYYGHAYGVVPEKNNAHFELRYGDDGVEREYLVVEGVLWRKFSEVEQIFDRDGGFKPQSMELQSSSVKGYINDEGLFVFQQAKFDGLCILGEGVTPAMVSSTIEKFSVSAMQTELSEMLSEFNLHFSTIQKKGDDIVEEEKDALENGTSTGGIPSEFAKKTKKEDEEKDSKETNSNQGSEDKSKDGDSTKKDDEKSSDENKDKKPSDDKEEETASNDKEKDEEDEDKKDKKKTPKNFTLKFELSHEDVRVSLYNALSNHADFKDSWMWIIETFDNYAIVEDENNHRILKINYVKHENNVSIGEYEEVFPMFVNESEKATIESLRSNIESLEQELQSLKSFKENVELADKEQKLSQYSATLSQEEYASIKANLKNFSMEDIEKEIGFILLKKNQFSANNQEEHTSTKVRAINNTESFEYGSLSAYFTK